LIPIDGLAVWVGLRNALARTARFGLARMTASR
jgi:hypothetical protein